MPAIPRSAQIDIRSVSMPKILWFPNGRSNNIVQRVNHYRGRYCGLTYEARQLSWSARIVCDWMNNRDLAHIITVSPTYTANRVTKGLPLHHLSNVGVPYPPQGRCVGAELAIQQTPPHPAVPRWRCGGRKGGGHTTTIDWGRHREKIHPANESGGFSDWGVPLWQQGNIWSCMKNSAAAVIHSGRI